MRHNIGHSIAGTTTKKSIISLTFCTIRCFKIGFYTCYLGPRKYFVRNFILIYHCVPVSDSTPELKSDAVNGLLAGTERRKSSILGSI